MVKVYLVVASFFIAAFAADGYIGSGKGRVHMTPADAGINGKNYETQVTIVPPERLQDEIIWYAKRGFRVWWVYTNEGGMFHIHAVKIIQEVADATIAKPSIDDNNVCSPPGQR